MHTVIGAFDDKAQAERAVDRLVQEGFDRSDVHIERQDAQADTSHSRPAAEHGHGHHGIIGFFEDLFGGAKVYGDDATLYDEAVRRGSCVVLVDARDEARADQAAACLEDVGAYDIDERAQQWRSEGWEPRGAAAAEMATTRGTGAARPNVGDAGREAVMDVVQEDLQVGKRRVEGGGVRVVQRLSEHPVREVLRLREERAIVDRRPVDRPAEPGELDSFREGTLEVRETAEQPVIAKTARVVEEVRVGKQVQEREQVVEDKVRRKDVEVQRLEGSANDAQERAAAADSMSRNDAERGRDIPGERQAGLTGKPRKNL